MKRIVVLVAFFAFLAIGIESASAAYVRGYFKSSGSYVQPHYRSNLNGLNYDNYSYKSYQPLYNSSYGKYNTYKWNTPSYYTQPNYYTGLSYYHSYHNSW